MCVHGFIEIAAGGRRIRAELQHSKVTPLILYFIHSLCAEADCQVLLTVLSFCTALGKMIFRFTNAIWNCVSGEWYYSFYPHWSHYCPVNDLLICSRMKCFVVYFNMSSVNESLVSLLTSNNDDYSEDDLIIHVMYCWHRRCIYSQV